MSKRLWNIDGRNSDAITVFSKEFTDPRPTEYHKIDFYDGIGVSVPDGVTAKEVIIAGNAVLSQLGSWYGLTDFDARRIACVVLESLRPTRGPAGD